MPTLFEIFGRILPGGIGKPEAERWYDHGVTLQRRGNLEEAVHAYTEAINRDPTLDTAFSNRGSAYLNLGNPEQAIRDADAAIRLKPRSPVAYSVRGNALHTMGEHDKAVLDLSRAISINPRFAGSSATAGRRTARPGG